MTAQPNILERRAHFRHRINLGKTVEIAGEPVPVMDISWGGICLYSPREMPEGEVVGFEHDRIYVEARVVRCAPVEDEPERPTWRLHCQFLEEPGHPQIEALMEYALDQAGVGAVEPPPMPADL